jgi:membrane-associated phospholipid phosphatase
MADRPLLARHRVISALAAAAFAAMVIVGVWYSGMRGPGRLDHAVDSRIEAHLAGHPQLLQRLVNLANPGSAVVICALLCALFLITGRSRLAALIVAGPALSGVLVDLVLKPVFDRRIAGALSYPSGHTAAAASIALVVVVAMLGPSRPPWPPAVRYGIGALAVAAAGVVAAALIAEGYHYATDTMGGLLAAIAFVLGAALSIDALAGRPRSGESEPGSESLSPDDAVLPRVKA